ncbi:hypothetical protein TNCV_858351, partial [Trichonephila clavipes]
MFRPSVAPCYFFNQASFYPSDFSFTRSQDPSRLLQLQLSSTSRLSSSSLQTLSSILDTKDQTLWRRAPHPALSPRVGRRPSPPPRGSRIERPLFKPQTHKELLRAETPTTPCWCFPALGD